MQGTFENLRCTALNAEQHLRTCNYWYTVTTGCATAHTAFETKAGLQRWLDERGLTCDIPSAVESKDYGKNLSNTSAIHGKYRAKMHMDYDEFYALPVVVRTKTLSNGDYTLALITEDDDGIRTVHVLNPNCHDRIVYDYRTIAKEMR